jgi:hypothetical protein
MPTTKIRSAASEVVTYRTQLQKLKWTVKWMFYWMIIWALKFMITKKT